MGAKAPVDDVLAQLAVAIEPDALGRWMLVETLWIAQLAHEQIRSTVAIEICNDQ